MRGIGPRALGLARAAPIGVRMMASEAKEEYDTVIIGGGESNDSLFDAESPDLRLCKVPEGMWPRSRLLS